MIFEIIPRGYLGKLPKSRILRATPYIFLRSHLWLQGYVGHFDEAYCCV